MNLSQAVWLGLLEGLTEFIPVSSTGHLIVAGRFLKTEGPAASAFEVFIQLGAILAVVWVYRGRFRKLLRPADVGENFAGVNGLILLALTTLPALAAGALAHGFIKRHLFNPATVAWGLGAGGLALLLLEKYLPKTQRTGLDSLTRRDAFLIGCFQCLALWPGISRSASTIGGGLCLGIERKTAAEYSFFAAVPVMFAAVFFDLYKSLPFLRASDVPVFAAGFAVSFVSALVCIRFFLRLLEKWTLAPFGWYRLAAAPLVYWWAK